MNVLSLFDGISCGQVALERAGIKVDTYYASEINKYAIQTTQKNHPNTKQLGDVNNIDFNEYIDKIDLLIGGSPCQGFSRAGNRLNFDDPRSKLFFKYIEALEKIKPKYFLLENVVMKKEWQDIITQHINVEPIKINSALVSAQNRERLYWTNIPNVIQPVDKHIYLQDILEYLTYKEPGAIRGRRLNKATILGRRLNKEGKREDYNKKVPITQCLEVRKTNTDKSNCLTTVDKDNVLTPLPPGRYPDVFKNNLPFRYYTVIEYCRLQTLKENYLDGCSSSQSKKLIGQGWTVDVIAHIFKYILK